MSLFKTHFPHLPPSNPVSCLPPEPNHPTLFAFTNCIFRQHFAQLNILKACTSAFLAI